MIKTANIKFNQDAMLKLKKLMEAGVKNASVEPKTTTMGQKSL